MPWANQNSKRHIYLNAHCSTIYNSQDMCFQGGHGVCLCLMSWCLTILGCLILFPHKFMSSWRGQKCLSVISGEPGPGLVVMNACWKNVQTQSDWPTVFTRVIGSLCLVGRVKWWWSVWSWCWDRALKVHCIVPPCEDLDINTSFKTYFVLSFPGRKFPRFWKVPTLGAWIWHHFLVSAKLWFLSPSSPMSSLTTGSQPARCLWWWCWLRLCGSRAPSTSPWPSRRCQRLSSASEESRFGDK